MPTATLTKPGIPKLSDVARRCHAPAGITTTGWPAVESKSRDLGIAYRWWQAAIGRMVLGKRTDGTYAATIGGVGLSIPRQVGKALDVNTPMLTANRGWTTMGELVAGDQVYAPSGEPVNVLFAHEPYVAESCYEVTTTCGRSVVADADHLWTVTDMRREKSVGPAKGPRVRTHSPEVLTTAELLARGLMRGPREFAYRLPQVEALSFPPVDLPVDPYVLGYWLGDGTTVNGQITTGWSDSACVRANLEAAGYSLGPTNTAKSVDSFTVYGLRVKLREIGVLGDKHVPEEYLTAGTAQREALLAGLLDSDGCCSPKGMVEFCATSRALAEGVLYLARSLGHRPVLSEGDATLRGVVVGKKYRVQFHSNGRDLFRLPRKQERCRAVDVRPMSIRSIEPVATRVVRCITVDSEDALYLAGRDLVPTHNTFLVAGLMFALCLLRPGFTVLWTAHRLKTAEETFGKLQVFARRRKIAPHILKVTTGSGDEVIYFRNGSRILFGARERGFGRGFDEVDALVFDEAQILTDSALDDMVPATNQSRQPEGALMLFMGTPPRPQDPGEVFTRMRADADLDDEDTGWVEFGADPDYTPTPLPAPLEDADWGQITVANPSFPGDTSKTAILRMRKKLGDDSFLREGLGIWTDRVSSRERFAAEWKRCAAPKSTVLDPVTLAVEIAHDLDSASIGLAGAREDGKWHVEVPFHLPGTAWVVAKVVAATAAMNVAAVVVDEKGPAGLELVAELQAAGVNVVLPGPRDLCAAYSTFVKACKPEEDRIRHRNQPELNTALGAVRTRKIGDQLTWERKNEDADVTPVVAASLALWGHARATEAVPLIAWR